MHGLDYKISLKAAAQHVASKGWFIKQSEWGLSAIFYQGDETMDSSTWVERGRTMMFDDGASISRHAFNRIVGI
jgi:hypothetical protein